MPRTVRLIALLALASSLAAPAASASVAGCAQGTPARAARTLVHEQAEVIGLDRVAGFDSALVLEPTIYPGVRHRLIRAGDRWCEASAINEAWLLSGRTGDAIARASAAAQLLGVAHFDGVTVRSATALAPGLVIVETHARTNGVEARWAIAVDDAGVRAARWVATGFAVEPFEGDWEGLSALPGLVRTYTRSATGLLAQVEPLLPQAPAVPETITEGTANDGFVIRINHAQTGYSPNAGQDTGVHDADIVRAMRDVALANYNEFLRWGMVKNWDSNVGTIWLDDSTTYGGCLACVVRSGTFNIHISNQIERILMVLGFEYPDQRKALATVVGHEMYHNWQNSYGKPDFGSRESAFSEGTARAQETAHVYSSVSYQPLSLIYHTGRAVPGVSFASNSCNGWDSGNMSADFANGPLQGKTYNACYFWLTWFGTHGTDGMVAHLAAMKTHQLKAGSYAENKGGIEEATGESIVPDLVRFASAALTDHGYTWADVDDSVPPIDWSVGLDRWSVATLAAGGSATATLRDGGVMAREVTVGGYPWLTSNRAQSALAQIRSTEAGAGIQILAAGDCIEPPAEGERVWLVGAYPETGTASVTIGHVALDPGLTQCPEEETP